MSGTTTSTPNNSVSGNMRPASMTMMSSAQRIARQFIPNSPRPPSGIIFSFSFCICQVDANTCMSAWMHTGRRQLVQKHAESSSLQHLIQEEPNFLPGAIYESEHIFELRRKLRRGIQVL